MTQLRISEAAALLHVSDDTVRRWVERGRLVGTRSDDGRLVVDGADLAAFVRARRSDPDPDERLSSARNRLPGIVTDVRRDGLVAQVEIQAGHFRLVSLMTREAADDLGLEVGCLATAVMKATTVIVEAHPDGRVRS